MSTCGDRSSVPATHGRALITRKDHYNVTPGSGTGTVADRPRKSFFKVRVNHDGSAWIVDTGRPERCKRYTIFEVWAADPFEAIRQARNM